MAQLEPGAMFRGGIFADYMLHPRELWPIPHLVDQLLDRAVLTFDMELNRPITAITHPAAHAKPGGFLESPRAKENTLDAACHSNPTRDHQTVLISGASSAFIPMTL